ncbi:unnamed protein product [Ectocarpus sp. CCAP 1310/34]|nr:unnamed protein product [Ectocarpus sp. CCAP 1310/34]
MTPPSELSKRIGTCADAVRFVLRGKDGYPSSQESYEEVIQYLPAEKATGYTNTNLVKAAVEYLKKSFATSDTSDRKISIALYVAIYVGHDHDHDDGVLAKEFCKRFQDVENYDKHMMTKIFNMSLCNDRILALLDAVTSSGKKKKDVIALIDHEFRVEFVLLYFNVVKSLVLRGQSLTDFGYPAELTADDVEAAEKTFDNHVSSIANKYWPCFKMEALKKPRVVNNLFPSGDQLPRVVIGREHIDFKLATLDTLRSSLDDKAGKGEFLEITRALICLPIRGPEATFRDLHFESVKKYFMETILGTSKVGELIETMSQAVDHADVQAKLASSEEENSLLKEEISVLKRKNLELGEELDSYSSLEERYRSVLKTLSTKDEKLEQYEHENRRLKQNEAGNTNLVKGALEYLRQGFADPDTPDRKVSIALYVAIYIGHDHDDGDGVLAKEFCERFQVLGNYDANVMTKIFNLSLWNDRILSLLDTTIAPGRKKKDTFTMIHREFRVEFVLLYFQVVKSLVVRGQSLTDLGYPTNLTADDVEASEETFDKHVSSIADKFWPCFKMEALKKPRVVNNLFPSGDQLPRVVIGREHIDFDLTTTDTLRDSLDDKAGKDEFVEIMRAIICLPMRGPVATFRDLRFESVKNHFMKTILETSHVDEFLGEIPETVDHANNLQAQLVSLNKEISAVMKQLESHSTLEAKFQTQKAKLAGYESEIRRLKLNEAGFKSAESHCREHHVNKKQKKECTGRMVKDWLLKQRFDDEDE